MTELYSPHQAGEVVGVSAHTIRRWCKDHAQYLSPSANPEPGDSRRLTYRDIEVMREIASLRNVEGLTVEKVNARLSEMIFDDAPMIVDTAPKDPEQAEYPVRPVAIRIEGPQTQQDGPGGVLMRLEDLDTVLALQERVGRLEGHEQVDWWRTRLLLATLLIACVAFVAGLIIGLALWFI